MGTQVFDVEETQGGSYRVLVKGYGVEVKVAAGRVLEERGDVHHVAGGGDATITNVH